MAGPFESFRPGGPRRGRPSERPRLPGPVKFPRRSLWDIFARAPLPAGPLPRSLERPGIPGRAVSKAFLESKFDLEEIWRTIRAARQEHKFQQEVEETRFGAPPPILPLVEIAPPGTGQEYVAAAFFAIPPRELREAYARGQDPWEDVIIPRTRGVEYSLNWLMDNEGFPGVLEFNFNDDDAFGLIYWERFEE